MFAFKDIRFFMYNKVFLKRQSIFTTIVNRFVLFKKLANSVVFLLY